MALRNSLIQLNKNYIRIFNNANSSFLAGYLNRGLHSNGGKLISEIEIDASQKMLNVSWLDGRNSSYPHIFLRDNCQCPKCFHPETKSRQLDIMEKVELDKTPKPQNPKTPKPHHL